MFTGIIEELGSIAAFSPHAGGAKMRISAKTVTSGTNDGDSIAVNGVCLTALGVSADGFAADVSQETLDRSTLGNLKTGSAVNIERAVTPSTRLGARLIARFVTRLEIAAAETPDAVGRLIPHPAIITQVLAGHPRSATAAALRCGSARKE